MPAGWRELSAYLTLSVEAHELRERDRHDERDNEQADRAAPVREVVPRRPRQGAEERSDHEQEEACEGAVDEQAGEEQRTDARGDGWVGRTGAADVAQLAVFRSWAGFSPAASVG